LGLLAISNAFMQETITNSIIGIVTVLYLPGFLLLLVIFPDERDIFILERIIVSLVLGIAIMSFFALILTYSPFGLNKFSIFLFSTFLSLILLILSWIQRIESADQPFSLNIVDFIVKLRNYLWKRN